MSSSQSKLSPAVVKLLEGNERFAKEPRTPALTLQELMGVTQPVLVITCMDPRVVPEEFCDFKTNEYGVLRTAGGRVKQTEREIAFVSAATPTTDIVIIHHTDCGKTHLSNDLIRKMLAGKKLGDENTKTLDFGEILDMDESVRHDVAFLRNSVYLDPKINVHGYVLELLTTGKLREVCVSWGKDAGEEKK